MDTATADRHTTDIDAEEDDLGIMIDLTDLGRGLSHRRLSRPSPWRFTLGGVMLAVGCFVIGILTLLDDIVDGAPGVEMAVGAWAWASTYIAASGVVLTIADTILDGR